MLRDNRDQDPAQMFPKGAYGLIYTLNLTRNPYSAIRTEQHTCQKSSVGLLGHRLNPKGRVGLLFCSERAVLDI